MKIDTLINSSHFEKREYAMGGINEYSVGGGMHFHRIREVGYDTLRHLCF